MSAPTLARMRIRRLAAATLSVSWLYFATPMPSARADDGALSLLDAVSTAEAQAPNVTAREAAVTAADYAIGPAGRQPDPQLLVGVENLPVDTADAFDANADFMTMRKVGVMQTFVRAEKRRLRSDLAAATAQRERALLASERLVVRESVAKAWIACAAAERRLSLLQSLRPRAEAAVAASIAALTAGRSTAADGIAAKSAQALLEDRVRDAQRDVEEARAEFARWLPDAIGRALGEAPDFTTLAVDPDGVVGRSAHHRELLAYDAIESAAEAELALAQQDKRPDWSLELAYAQRGSAYSNMISLQLRVDLPVFAAHRQDPLIASRRALLAQVEAEREAALRMHTTELRKTVAAWHSARDRVQRYERELLPLAEARIDAALSAFRGGRGESQAVLTALDDAIEQRMAYTELVATLGRAWATLHFAFPEER